jgi:hypothetical protein
MKQLPQQQQQQQPHTLHYGAACCFCIRIARRTSYNSSYYYYYSPLWLAESPRMAQHCHYAALGRGRLATGIVAPVLACKIIADIQWANSSKDVLDNPGDTLSTITRQSYKNIRLDCG